MAFCEPAHASQKMYVNQFLSFPETGRATGPNGGFGSGSEYVFLGAAFSRPAEQISLGGLPFFECTCYLCLGQKLLPMS
jgi:hypothetical protein